jgi:hypothetical protein
MAVPEARCAAGSSIMKTDGLWRWLCLQRHEPEAQAKVFRFASLALQACMAAGRIAARSPDSRRLLLSKTSPSDLVDQRVKRLEVVELTERLPVGGKNLVTVFALYQGGDASPTAKPISAPRRQSFMNYSPIARTHASLARHIKAKLCALLASLETQRARSTRGGFTRFFLSCISFASSAISASQIPWHPR